MNITLNVCLRYVKWTYSNFNSFNFSQSRDLSYFNFFLSIRKNRDRKLYMQLYCCITYKVIFRIYCSLWLFHPSTVPHMRYIPPATIFSTHKSTKGTEVEQNIRIFCDNFYLKFAAFSMMCDDPLVMHWLEIDILLNV